MRSQFAWDSPIGRLLIAADDTGICEIRLLKPEDEVCEESEKVPLLQQAVQELEEYFAGMRRIFDLPLSASGTDFERTVWRALGSIPFGETRTYGQLAARIGRPKGARAVGGACARNPLLIVVPCHRVIGSNGALTGFAAGMEAKRILLTLEGYKETE